VTPTSDIESALVDAVVNYRETWRCLTCGHDHRVISATLTTLTTLKPPAVGDRAWGPCQGACNSTGAQPARLLELVAVETMQ
jgi:hypothetical protein